MKKNQIVKEEQKKKKKKKTMYQQRDREVEKKGKGFSAASFKRII